MKNDQKQSKNVDALWLLNQGYTIAQAARLLGYSTWHLNEVLKGNRKSDQIQAKLIKLPKRILIQRRKK